jgi:hypothetical protein
MRVAAQKRALAALMLAWCVAGTHAFALGSRPAGAEVRRRVRAGSAVPLQALCDCGRGSTTSMLSAVGATSFGMRMLQQGGGRARLAREGPVMQTGGQDVNLDKGQFGGGSGGTAVLEDTDFSVNTILKQLESIQQGTPKNIVILGTRHCSFLHQQIIELLSYALVLSDNHIFTSGATGTHAAAIRGALRADNPELLTVILPQTVSKQPREIRELLGEVRQLIELGHDQLPLDAASRICNSELLSKGDQVKGTGTAPHRRTRRQPPTRPHAHGYLRASLVHHDTHELHSPSSNLSRAPSCPSLSLLVIPSPQLIVFAFHDSKTLRETIEEAKAMSLLTTVLFLD